MKMKKRTAEEIFKVLELNREKIVEHKKWLVETSNYNVLDTRLAFDCYRLMSTEFRNKVRDNEDLNDNHIATGVKSALKKLNII